VGGSLAIGGKQPPSTELASRGYASLIRIVAGTLEF
jgi:hypothetical protein